MKFKAGIAVIMWLQKRVRRFTMSTGFWAAISVGVVIAVGASLSVEYWGWLQGGTDDTSNTAAIRNVALVIGGIVAILIALWRSLVAERQATAAQRQTETAERVYLSDRYRQAASMLGDNELPVRLGGIFSLERLAEDHPSEFRREVIRLLVEFVRTPPSLQEPQPKVWDGWLHIERTATREDVQVAMTAIAELLRVDAIQNEEEPVHLDLHNAQLCGVELKLPSCIVNLQRANLKYARLEKSNLTGARLQWADCRHARFNDSDLSSANMTNADFSNVRAYGACFVGATMPKTMVNAVLNDTDMRFAKFPRAYPRLRESLGIPISYGM